MQKRYNYGKFDTAYLAIKAAFYGFSVGDAIGVPVEFFPREQLDQKPISCMTGYGTHFQEPGVWSDDTSLMLATADSFAQKHDFHFLAKKMIEWMDYGKYSATGKAFGIGNATRKSLETIRVGTEPLKAGRIGEFENGNGSLMRILPLAFYLKNVKYFWKRKQIIHEVSSITHRHIISKVACHFYVEFVIHLLNDTDIKEAY